MHSREPAPAARATTLPTPSITPTKHRHRLHHPHHHRHHHRGPSRETTQPRSSNVSCIYTAADLNIPAGKTGEESRAGAGGGGGGKDEEDRKAWAVLRGKKVERELGDKYEFPISFLFYQCFRIYAYKSIFPKKN